MSKSQKIHFSLEPLKTEIGKVQGFLCTQSPNPSILKLFEVFFEYAIERKKEGGKSDHSLFVLSILMEGKNKEKRGDHL